MYVILVMAHFDKKSKHKKKRKKFFPLFFYETAAGYLLLTWSNMF